MKKRIIIVLAFVLLVAGGGIGALIINKQNNTKSSTTVSTATSTESDPKKITYSGQDGLTALALLEQNAEVVMSGTGENAFVTSINGVVANSSNQYWAFYVNGTAATVGAGSYTTKNSDTITWELTSF